MIPKVGQKIKAFGQEAVVSNIEHNSFFDKNTIQLETPIVVPGVEYTRDWVWEGEIQEII